VTGERQEIVNEAEGKKLKPVATGTVKRERGGERPKDVSTKKKNTEQVKTNESRVGGGKIAPVRD